MTNGEFIVGLYESSTAADFELMENKLSALPPDEPVPEGAVWAALLLAMREMERSEQEATA